MLGKVPRAALASQQCSRGGMGGRCPEQLGEVPAGLGGSSAALCPGNGRLGLPGQPHTLPFWGQRASQPWHQLSGVGEGRINKQLTLLLLGSAASLLPAQEHHLPPKSRRWRIPHRCLQDNMPLAWNWNKAISRSNVISLNSYSSCTAWADITGFWTVPSPLL